MTESTKTVGFMIKKLLLLLNLYKKKSLINRYSKYLAFILIIFPISNSGYSQSFSESGINLGVKIGGAKLLGEIPNNFSQIINEFDNKTGISSSFELSKNVSPRWEIGAEVGYSKLMGSTNSPEFSAEGNQPGIPEEINEPVEFINKLFGMNLFFQYFFKQANTESVFIPFARSGGGVLNYFSSFKYIDAPEDKLIFGKGSEGYTKLSTPVFFIGTGFKSAFSSKFYMVTSIDFNLTDYDFLDAVHNYDSNGNRLELIGLYTEFKIGIFYNATKKSGTKSGSSVNSHLPFSR